MTTVLQYLVIAAVIALLLFGLALLIFGRGERLAALPARTSPAQLPDREIEGADVRRVRFALALRGYRMSDVDWTLERLADELDRTRQELAEVSATVAARPEHTTGHAGQDYGGQHETEQAQAENDHAEAVRAEPLHCGGTEEVPSDTTAGAAVPGAMPAASPPGGESASAGPAGPIADLDDASDVNAASHQALAGSTPATGSHVDATDGRFEAGRVMSGARSAGPAPTRSVQIEPTRGDSV